MEMENITFNNFRQPAHGITSIAKAEKYLSTTVISFLS